MPSDAPSSVFHPSDEIRVPRNCTDVCGVMEGCGGYGGVWGLWRGVRIVEGCGGYGGSVVGYDEGVGVMERCGGL